ncbi:MAG TPA: hypothetical protein VHK90_01775, partial [Thermoanaerobaculia bacterium]|nr:hypothetical protein [Thermoanaerobaculia bacterium]
MKPLRRLYGYLRSYKAWALLAFGSMIIFALTQTVLVALVQPLIDDVLSPPGAVVKKEPTRVDRALENLPLAGDGEVIDGAIDARFFL